MKAKISATDQGRAPGLYDEQLQRLEQEKSLLNRGDMPATPTAKALFAATAGKRR